MPLTIDFKSGDRLILNGAVIENVGSNAKLLLHNQATILRGREILSEQNSKTPASRIYFTLQCAYIFPEKQDDYIKLYEKLIEEYLEACPSASDIVEKIREKFGSGDLYGALKVSRKLIDHESQILEKMIK